MNKILLSIMVCTLCALVNGATIVNWTGIMDSSNINEFKADSFKITKAFDFTNNENKLTLFVFDDSLHTGRASDSVACEIGYQMGCPVYSTAGAYDTTWSNCIVLDTIKTTTAGTRYDPSKYAGTSWPLVAATETNTRPHGQIDTTVGAASSCVLLPQVPFWSPIVRYYVKGMIGNCGTFIRCKFILTQRRYNPMRAQ